MYTGILTFSEEKMLVKNCNTSCDFESSWSKLFGSHIDPQPHGLGLRDEASAYCKSGVFLFYHSMFYVNPISRPRTREKLLF